MLNRISEEPADGLEKHVWLKVAKLEQETEYANEHGENASNCKVCKSQHDGESHANTHLYKEQLQRCLYPEGRPVAHDTKVTLATNLHTVCRSSITDYSMYYSTINNCSPYSDIFYIGG